MLPHEKKNGKNKRICVSKMWFSLRINMEICYMFLIVYADSGGIHFFGKYEMSSDESELH